MPWPLDYPQQLTELERMARLDPPRAVRRDPPALLLPDPAAACLVCAARPARACAACRGVAYCGVEHQRRDARWHDPVCDDLRAIAEDAALAAEVPRDVLAAELLAAARRLAPGRVPADWDELLGPGPLTARRRLLTDLATRPLTLAHALARLRIAARGDALAVHVMAAAGPERDVPLAAWAEVTRLLAAPRLDLALVGPELPATPPDTPTDAPLTLRLHPGLYRRALWRTLGRPDLVVGYDCGILLYPSWKPTILELCGSGTPFVITSYRPWEAAAEARLLTGVGARCVLPPTASPFASRAGKRSTTIANDLAHDNAFLSAWR